MHSYSCMLSCYAAEAVWRNMPAATATSSPGPQSQAGGPAPMPEPAASRVALGSPAGPAYMWMGSTRSLLPALRPGQSAEVPLQVCFAGVVSALLTSVQGSAASVVETLHPWRLSYNSFLSLSGGTNSDEIISPKAVLKVA